MKTLSTKLILTLTAFLLNFSLLAQTGKQVLVSADSMNILYEGIDNPLSIVVQGIANDKLIVTMTNGTITGSNGKYFAKPIERFVAIIEVSAEIKPGKLKKIGSYAFRIKGIPLPVAQIGDVRYKLSYSKLELLKDPWLKARVSDPWDPPFNLKFVVLSFTFIYHENDDIKQLNVMGNKFTPEIIKIINNLKVGSRISFENIKVMGPDGNVRAIAPFEVKISEND